jgi:hypothetical protein
MASLTSPPAAGEQRRQIGRQHAEAGVDGGERQQEIERRAQG